MLQGGKLGFQILAQSQNVTAFTHRHRNANAIFTFESHPWLGWLTKATIDVSDIAQLNGLTIHQQRHFFQFIYTVQLTTDPNLNAIGLGFKIACAGHGILLLQSLLNGTERNPKLGGFGIGQINPDFLVLQSYQLDLAHIFDPL